MAKKEFDLYSSYRRTTRHKVKYSLFSSPAAPALLILVIALAAWGILLRFNVERMEQVEQLESWLYDPAINENYNEAVAKQAYNEGLLSDLKEAETLKENLATYPAVSSELLDEIGAVGGEKVEMVITGYNSTSGELLFEAHSREVIDIPGYVLALQETELFHTVEYTGYEYEEEEYILRLRCTLQADAGRKEAEA